jgi:hypothetical protein
MNRKQRRKISHMDTKTLTEFVKSFEGVKDPNLISEGTKVKLNYKNISSQSDYKTKNPRYFNFVEKHKDDIMTVEFDPNCKQDSYLVCLKEDINPIKWLWLVTDLIKIN